MTKFITNPHLSDPSKTGPAGKMSVGPIITNKNDKPVSPQGKKPFITTPKLSGK